MHVAHEPSTYMHIGSYLAILSAVKRGACRIVKPVNLLQLVAIIAVNCVASNMLLLLLLLLPP